ncbi:DUF72 domain-containing protein [Mycetohabitans endofungorum]|uniref:DUF72 domain-containing protein n=1 Tax=Mycetohabitans endofungorum TaxID=417203 RepID=UPI002B05DC80|nr:DUF72 domain-containing protein [Mycetohabitans endofungorum]
MPQGRTARVHAALVAPLHVRQSTVTEQAPPDNGQFHLFGTPPPAAATGKPTAAASAHRRSRGEILPARIDERCQRLGAALPPNVRLGTSSWSYPGWNGIVYGNEYSDSRLSRNGLAAYSTHPLLRSVSIDRTFYAPLTVGDYARYASQVPDAFRFTVKATSSITDATVRGERGMPGEANPCFLDTELAQREFIEPCLQGLGHKAGALVFQFPPLPDRWIADPAAFVQRLQPFLEALPALPDGVVYAVEIRDAILLTPRLMKALRAARVRYCIGIHARMPSVQRQAAALALLDGNTPGPLVVRWNLHAGLKHQQAEARYAPFDTMLDEDHDTREALAALAARHARAGQSVLITASNNAEGCAPLSCIALADAIVAHLAPPA